jgi:hypothetical protein
MEGFDLHDLKAGANAEPEPKQAGIHWEELAEHLGEREVAKLKQIQAVGVALSYLVRALVYPIYLYHRLIFKLSPTPPAESAASLPPTNTQQGEYWVHQMSQCRLRLPEGATGIPSRFLAFRIGDLDVASYVMSADRARLAITQSRRGSVTLDENFWISGLPAKAVGWEEEEVVFIQTPWVVVVFSMPRGQAKNTARIAEARRTIETFEIP